VPVLELYADGEDVEQLIGRAIDGRPEREQLDALFAATSDSLKADRFGAFIPRVGFGYNSGRFGGGPGSAIDDTGHRDDLSLQLY